MRITKNTLRNNVEAVNCALSNRNIDYRFKLVGQYGKQSIYLMKEERIIKMLFMGTSREVYHYLWGVFDMMYHVM